MTVSDTAPIAGKRNIDSFALKSRSLLILVDIDLKRFEGRFDPYFDFIGDSAKFCALLFGEFSEVLQFEREESGLTRKISGSSVF
jgi:hypothetical protein